MSAIWGVIDFTGKEISKEICESFEQVFQKKKIQKLQTICQNGFYLGCGLQFVNEEAAREQYPYHAENIYLVADAILDNRRELQQSFSMRNPLSQAGVDGSILFECLQQDFDRALDTMLGAYTVAQYDEKKQIFTLLNDATGNRSVYYMWQKNRFYFSSLLTPLLRCIEKKVPNRHWFFRFFAENGLRISGETTQTPYENIFRLEPGEVLTCDKTGIQRRAYWNPLKNCKVQKRSEKECAQLVRKVFGTAVRGMIRNGTETGILLSGGLDSNAVAAFAAPYLEKQGKKLYSFTSVPDAEHEMEITREYGVADERSYVREVQQLHANLEPEWIGCNHYDMWKESREIQKILEFPYKSIPNFPWMRTAYQRAAEKGCGILLSGQYGNITVSYGNFENLFATLLKKRKFLSLYREICLLSQKTRCSRKRAALITLKESLPIQDDFICKEELLPDSWKKYQKDIRDLRGKCRWNRSAHKFMRYYMYDKPALRQIGEAEVKLSLDTGVVHRDPTRDKRFIELVLSFPVERFVHGGEDRRLVRRYMEDIIPLCITDCYQHRGRQAVGTQKSIAEQWPQIKQKLQKEWETGHAADFLNLPLLQKQLDASKIEEDEQEFKRMRMIYCGLCSEFIGSNYDE